MPEDIREEYPSNSYKDKAQVAKAAKELEERAPVKAATKGKRKKKSVFSRIGESLFGEDTSSVGNYILWDVLIPAAKNTIVDMVNNGIEMLIFGESKGSRTRRDKDRSYVSYSSMFDRDRDRERTHRIRSRHKFDEIVIRSRGEAEEVLSSMIDMIDKYNSVSVADFYDLLDMEHEYTDRKYGWTNLRTAEVERTREGYVLILPRAIQLD